MAERNRIIRFPLPILGLNTVNPYVEHDSGYARELTNYSLKDGRLFMRPSVDNDVFNAGIAATASTIWWFDPNTATRMSILSDGSRINYTTGVVAEAASTFGRHAQTTQLTFSGTATTLNLVFGLYRKLVVDGGTAVAPDNTRPLNSASTFAAAGPYAAFGRPYCGCAHKGRLYYANATYTIEWGSVGQVAGAFPAANTLSLEQFMNGQNILRIFSVSLSPGTAPSQNLFAIFGDAGRVLVFEGDNPGSATWNLIAAYDMPTPISRAGFLEIDGDIFIATRRYAYWFRDLFSGGAQSAYGNAPTQPIENLWNAVTWDGFAPFLEEIPHVFYYEPLDAIICQCSEKNTVAANLSDNFEYNNEAVYFVYYRKYKAWSLWAMPPLFSPIIQKVGVPYSVPYGVAYKAAIFFLQENNIGYDSYITATPNVGTIQSQTSWKTGYAFLDHGIGLTAKAARVWLQDRQEDSSARVTVRSIFDYSDFNAPWGFYTQNMVTQINPGRYAQTIPTMAQTNAGQHNPLAQIGGDGGGVSIQITQESEVANPGFTGTRLIPSVYGLSALVQPGSEIF